MALRISFFNTPEHRVYNYKPRYYDPAKEHIEELREKYSGEEAREKRYIPGMNIREAYRKGLTETKSEGNKKLKTIIILITLLVVMVAAYYLAEGFAEMLAG